MDDRTVRLNVVLFFLVCVMIGCKEAPVSFDHIEYRGEQIKLTKAYSDYDEYKNDPNNIDHGELDKIERLMTSATIKPLFTSRRECVRAVFEIRFPGYGLASLGATQADGSQIALLSVEIPRRGKDRYFVFRAVEGGYQLIDDFIYQTNGTSSIRQVKLESNRLTYYDQTGKEVRDKMLGFVSP